MARNVKTKAPTQTYTVRQASPKLGKVGSTVSMTARQAKYWVLAGALQATGATPSEGTARNTATKPAAKITTTRRKGK